MVTRSRSSTLCRLDRTSGLSLTVESWWLSVAVRMAASVEIAHEFVHRDSVHLGFSRNSRRPRESMGAESKTRKPVATTMSRPSSELLEF